METTELSLTTTQTTQQIQSNQIVLAMDLVPGVMYQTAKTERTKHRCHVLKKADVLDEQIEIQFYEHQYNRAWMSCLVPLDYPFIKLNGDIHKNISRDFGDGQRKRGLKSGGRITGMGMMECWGLYFRKFISVPGGRALIIQSMVAEFPDVTERILKWVDSYKSYYNMGKLPGCSKQIDKAKWITNTDPLASLEDSDE